MYKTQLTPLGEPRLLLAEDHAAVLGTVTKVFGLPATLDATNIQMLTGIAHGASEPGPWQEIIKAIEGAGRVRVEAVRYPDVQTGTVGAEVMNIRK